MEFKRGREISFTFNGEKLKGYEGETIAAALHAQDIKVLGKSLFTHRPRGFYCAIGNCASCNMVVNNVSNVRTCITDLEEEMVVELQEGAGSIL